MCFVLVCSVYPGTRSVSCRKVLGARANKALGTWASGRQLIGRCDQQHHWTSDSIFEISSEEKFCVHPLQLRTTPNTDS